MVNHVKVVGSVVLAVVIAVVIIPQIQQSYTISYGSYPILSNNWWEALNWIKNNTEECSVIATYWDPGHFIRAIAQRSIVFDGASQGMTRTIEVNSTNLSEQEIKDIAVLDNYKIEVDKGRGTTKIMTARIQDIATSMFTDNEATSVRLLEKYKKPGCNSLYFLATSDLIGKSVWWSYFSTWRPGESGKQYSYSIIQLSQEGKTDDGGDVSVYSINGQQAILIYKKGDTIKPLLQDGNGVAEISRLLYVSPNGEAKIQENKNSTIPGLVWMSSDKRVIVFIPPEIENSVFTKMFLLEGFGLNKFKLVKSWGGEVKLFKVEV